jgi:hypothetical protein
MSTARKPWSVQTRNTRSGTYAIIKGKAYPQITLGTNPTRTVSAPLPHHGPAAREAFYNDPAVKLSEADLDDIDGATGAPLCVEHNQKDVVGHVHHSWRAEGQCLEIIGRIPLNTTRGKQIVADIQCGKYKGFSVGYSTDLHPETGDVLCKRFNEISLVEEPFFEGCNLTVGVMASKNAGEWWKIRK